MADLNETLKNLQNRFSALTTTQKALVIGLPVVAFSLIVTLIIYALQPDYAVLYSNMNPEDMNAVLTELDKEGIKYKVGADGRSVYVEEGKVRDIRLKLAAKGIPNKGVIGYELFDKGTIGLSEFQQRVNFKRAIEGELVRTILRFKNIEDARVHIALPEKSIFLRDEKEPSASVFIKLRPGSSISLEQVKAIRNLVSASVENLKPENVVVIDDKGRNLTSALEDEGEEAVSNKQLKIRKEFEREIEKKIQTALEEVLGYGNVKVRVSAELDFSKHQKREEIYDPDQVAVVSEQKRKEKSTGSQMGGVPGAESNIPPGAGVNTQQTSTTEKKETITNYEVSKKEIVSVDNTLKIKRLSVGVIVNSELKDVDVESIKKVVSASVGLDEKRGDTLSVVSVPFKKPPIAESEPSRFPIGGNPLVAVGVGAIAGALLLFILLKLLRKKAQPEVVIEAATGAGAMEEQMATISGSEALREAAKELEIVKTITEVARKEPKKVAALVKLWLREE